MHNLFVTDLDGTFVMDSVAVSQPDLSAYEQLQPFGDFAIATGRSIREIDYVIDQNQLDVSHRIGFNGALVQDKETLMFKQTIPKEDLVRVFDYLKRESLIFDALDGEKRIGNFQHEKPASLWNMELICQDNPFHLLENKEIYKVNVRPNKTECDAYYHQIKQTFPNLEVFKSGSSRIEITAKNISKASGIDLIKPGYERIIAFGDSGNDVDMFQTADLSYCMSHAPKEVQQRSSHVVKDFAAAIKHFVTHYELSL